MQFQVDIRIMPRKGILDPQGNAVAGALSALGFEGVAEVHVGRSVRLEMTAASRDAALERANAMCRALLANPVTEDFEVEIHETAGSTR